MKEFIDILVDSLTNGWSNSIGSKEAFIALCMASLIAAYIYTVYIFFAKKNFYSRDFNIALVCVTLITTGLVLTIQSNILITLSVGGALSIIRFRTAIKNPMDLVFLFWAIACGIMCGTGVVGLAMMLSLFLTAVTFILTKLPLVRAPYLMIINAANEVEMDKVNEILKKECKYYSIKSNSMTRKHKDMTVELRTDAVDKVVEKIAAIEHIESVSVLEHNGDVTF